MSRSKRAVLALSVMASSLLFACQDVTTSLYTPDLASPQSDVFTLDIAMLSEWQGSYEPAKESQTFCYKPNTYFRQATPNYINYKLDAENHSEDYRTITLDLNFPYDEHTTPEPFNVNCFFSTKSVQEKYGIAPNCIAQINELPETTSENTGELQYFCTLNLNVSDVSKLNSEWASIFPDVFNSNSGTIKIENVPICAYISTSSDGEQFFNVRPNDKVSSISYPDLQRIADSLESTTFNLTLFGKKNSYASPDYYEVKCNRTETAENSDICKFDDEDQYECYTFINGATGLRHVWKDMFKRENVPLFIVGNGDNFGASQPNSREFDDYPTVQLLSALGFSADTFGNHVFDKDITELNDMLDEASYPHVISNIANVPKNIPKLAPYTIWQVPADESECPLQDSGTCCKSADNPDGIDCLGVGVVSAIDASLMYFIQPGKFGSLQTTDYCDVVYALQRAYNNNARAFLILSHLSTASDFTTTEFDVAGGVDFTNSETLNNSNNYNARVSVFKLLQLLFSLKDPDMDLCPETHLILSTSRLQQKRDLCPAICETDQDACKSICNSACSDGHCDDVKLQKSLINEMNLEIFNGIIGIFTAASDKHMVGFASKDENNNYPGLVSFDIKEADTHDPYYFSKKYYKTQNLFGSDKTLSVSDISDEALSDLFDAYPISVNENVFTKANAKTHPIWVIQLPDGGDMTAKLEVTITKNNTDNNRGNFAQPYTASVTGAFVVPTIQSPDDVDTPTPASCIENLEALISTDPVVKNASSSDLRSQCQSLKTSDNSDPLTEACSCYNYYLDAQSYLVGSQTDIVSEPSYNKCQRYLSQRAIQNTNRSIDPAFLQDIWNCLYYSKDYAMCTEDNSYWDPLSASLEADPYFSEITYFDLKKVELVSASTDFFDHIEKMTETELRESTTFITSWVTEVLLSAFNRSVNNRFDILLLNVGSFNRIQDINITSYTKSALRNIITYANTFMSVTLSPSSFVNYITNPISTTNESRGQYPVFAGIMLSTTDPKDMPTQITEMWAVHQSDEFYPSDCQDEDCTCAASQCYTRNAANILKEPLYQLIDIIIPEEDEDCDVAFKYNDVSEENRKFAPIYSSTNSLVNENSGIFILKSDPQFTSVDRESFNNYFTKNYNSTNYTINQNLCASAQDGDLFNIYYPGTKSLPNLNKFFPMRFHKSMESLSSSGKMQKVCKCYLTAIEENVGYTTTGEMDYAVLNPDSEKPVKDRELNIAVVYYIATGGDGYKLPDYVNPTVVPPVQAKFDLVSPEAYLPNGTYQNTIDIIENYFTEPQSGKDQICSGLTSNPKLVDGRSDSDFVWDNSFYRHLHVSESNTFIMNVLNDIDTFKPYYMNGLKQ